MELKEFEVLRFLCENGSNLTQREIGERTGMSLGTVNQLIFKLKQKGFIIVRRIDDLGRVVIPKEIRRTMRIREGDLSQTTLTPLDKFCMAIHSLAQRITAQ